MRCDEFQNHLQEVLDARQVPLASPVLQQHAAACARCRDLLAIESAIGDHLDEPVSEEVPAGFAARVVDRFCEEDPSRVRRSSHVAVRWALRWGPIATAAIVLLWFTTMLRQAEQPRPDTHRARPRTAVASSATPATAPPESPVKPQRPGPDAFIRSLPDARPVARRWVQMVTERFDQADDVAVVVATSFSGWARPFTTAYALHRSLPRASGDDRSRLDDRDGNVVPN